MLYLIDSSARDSNGHNLEYLERISTAVKSDFLILGNRELKSEGKSNYLPTFEYSTWDFGRFGFRKKRISAQFIQVSRTLRASKSLLVTEKLIEISAEFLAMVTGKFVLNLSRFTKQSRYFRRDLGDGLSKIQTGSTILVSTTNGRELAGLNNWIKNCPIQKYPIFVILRRPPLDLRSIFEIPFLFIDALIYISAIRGLSHAVRFFADTPSLAARLSKRTKKSIEHIPALGFEIQAINPKAHLDFAIAPNSRPETRSSAQDMTSIPALSNSIKGNIDSKSYRELLSTTKSIVLPYDPLRYRSRSSGIFVEALTLGILPIVPSGTSMSREIAKLNSKILLEPESLMELNVGEIMDLGQFNQENLLITFDANFIGSIVLEISEGIAEIRSSIHDFFESECLDMFYIKPSPRTVMSFKIDRIAYRRNFRLKVKVNKIEKALIGVPYLDGDLPEVLSLLKNVTYCGHLQDMISEHSPQSICNRLGI